MNASERACRVITTLGLTREDAEVLAEAEDLIEKKMKNIPIGSLITAYEAGYFVLIQYEGNQCIFIKVATKTGVPVNSKREMSCDEHWCHLVTKEQIGTIIDNFNTLYGMIS